MPIASAHISDLIDVNEIRVWLLKKEIVALVRRAVRVTACCTKVVLIRGYPYIGDTFSFIHVGRLRLLLDV